MLMTSLETVATVLEGLGKSCDIPQTVSTLCKILEPQILQRCRERDRVKCEVAILSYLISDIYLRTHVETLLKYFQIETLTEEEFSGGSYVLTSDSCQTVETRLATMVQENAIGFDIKPIYSLMLPQIKCLLRYCFNSDPGERVEAKIRLLSTVSHHIRQEAQRPYFTQAFASTSSPEKK